MQNDTQPDGGSFRPFTKQDFATFETESTEPEIAHPLAFAVVLDGTSLSVVGSETEHFIDLPSAWLARQVGEMVVAELKGTDGPADFEELLERFGFRQIQ